MEISVGHTVRAHAAWYRIQRTKKNCLQFSTFHPECLSWWAVSMEFMERALMEPFMMWTLDETEVIHLAESNEC